MGDQRELTLVEEPKGLTLKVLNFQDGVIQTNADEIMVEVEGILKRYEQGMFPVEKIPEAKKARAELNAAVQTLNSKRIEFEKAWMKPFEPFRQKVSDICAKIKEVSAQIDAVIKTTEARERSEKRAEIEAFFRSLGPQVVTLEQVADPSWLNKTVTMAVVRKEISSKLTKVHQDLAILERTDEPEARAHYLSTLDLTAALRRADGLRAMRDRLAKEAEAKAAAPAPAPETPITPEDAPVRIVLGGGGARVVTDRPPPRTVVVTLRNPTDGQLDMIRAFLDASGVLYSVA
jgi:hypothetical protein